MSPKSSLGVCLMTFGFSAAFAQTPNMDAGLSVMVRSYKAGPASPGPAGSSSLFSYDSLAQRDAQGRVLVEIVLDGSVGIDLFPSILLSLNANIAGVNPAYGNGAISAYLPLGSLETLGSSRGVDNLALGYKPLLNTGSVTSQGAKVMHADIVNSTGITGAGITVGVLSDSFNMNSAASTNYAKDMSTGDLPTLKYLVDDGSPATDEGRAMAQIVYDVAPHSSLCFETAEGGMATFAAHILDLRTNPACAADVIVDDVSYFNEPFFSDGQIAQAVNSVVAKNASYFSAAGNNQGNAFYASPANFVAASTVPGINLSTISSCLNYTTGGTGTDTGGGFLDFGANAFNTLAANTLAVNISSSSGGTLVMQWDDPFDTKGITTDLNFLIFNTAGTCVYVFGANNFTTNQAIEITPSLTGSAKMMIARTSAGTHRATRVELLNMGFTSPIFGNVNTPVTWGHSAADGAISVGAYRYTSVPSQQSPFIPTFESFSSPGPVTIAFNASGGRLGKPVIRQKPDLSAPDGVDTTFFGGNDWDSDGHPNFFGTSAAAPHAAGVAALMLQKSGGSGSLTPAQLKSYMLTSIPARVIPYSSNTSTAWSPFDGFGLIDAEPDTRTPVTVTLSINPTLLTYGQTATVIVSVTPKTGSGSPAGVVSLVTASGVVVPLGTYSGSGMATFPTTGLPTNPITAIMNPMGSPYAVTAHFAGDATFAPGDSAPVTINVMPGPSPPPCPTCITFVQ